MNDQAHGGEHGDQLAIGDLLPTAGDRYVNVHAGNICTVLTVERRRRTWVMVRQLGREVEYRLPDFCSHHRPV